MEQNLLIFFCDKCLSVISLLQILKQNQKTIMSHQGKGDSLAMEK